MLSILFALIGLLAGGLINELADDLPLRAGVQAPHCRQCGYRYSVAGWPALGRLAFVGDKCPRCATTIPRRALLVESSTMLIFAYLPLVVANGIDALVIALYIAILILIMIIDLEHRLILHRVTLPATLLAFLGSIAVSFTNLPLAMLGALLGLTLFFVFFVLGRFLFGAGALGFGDVMLAMMMGAMLGFPNIIFGLLIGMLIAGLLSLYLLLIRQNARKQQIAYGAYLATGALVIIVWGPQIYRWYFANG